MTAGLKDVVIFNMETRVIDAVIGTSLNDRQAERREDTGLSRINLDSYSVQSLPAGKFSVGDKVPEPA